MTEEGKRAQQAYQKQWREKNRDKVRKYCARYWDKKAQEINPTTSTTPAGGDQK